jgi:hypothetical protein
MQAPSSRIPPKGAAAVTDDLYKPCAYLRKYNDIFCLDSQPLGIKHGNLDKNSAIPLPLKLRSIIDDR